MVISRMPVLSYRKPLDRDRTCVNRQITGLSQRLADMGNVVIRSVL